MVLLGAPTDCSRCTRLCLSRKMVVQGAGPLPADILVVAQAPGRLEEIHGYPLYEKAWSGSRLRYKLMPLAGIDPEQVRYENIVRCRPPRHKGGDDPPTAGEIKKCAPFLLEVITEAFNGVSDPCIITLGIPAWKWFNTEYALSTSHGFRMTWTHPDTNDSIMIVPMYHPAAATPNRTPALAKVMISDWKYLGEVLAGRGEESKAEFLADRLNTKWVREGPV